MKPAPHECSDSDEEGLAMINPSELVKHELIGDGQTATVFRGEYKGQEVAIKEMHDISLMKQKDQVNLEREINILRRVSHPHLVGLIGIMEHPGKIWIVTNLCRGGDVFELLHNSGMTLAWKQKLRIATDVASAMKYLHSQNPPIIHRDLKSLNLLLMSPVNSTTDEPYVKVADFGLARMIEEGNMMTKNTGTYHWMAPELLHESSYDCKVDVYSYSMVLYEVICQDLPFVDVKPMMVCIVVMRGERPDMSKVPADTPEFLSELMQLCWAASPEDRPSFAEMLPALTTACPS
mmetsp:Transcript_95637/g.276327  ORF Transcript_95637/g.276327 Transcript_95637/m.276327 type:complete len:292 (-) Transcript_95637:182-1057(-)